MSVLEPGWELVIYTWSESTETATLVYEGKAPDGQAIEKTVRRYQPILEAMRRPGLSQNR